MIPALLQGTTRRTPETGPKTGAFTGTGSRPGGPGAVGHDRRWDSSEGPTIGGIKTVLEPLLAREAVLCPDGGEKGTIVQAAREIGVAHRAENLTRGSESWQGGQIQNANAKHLRLKEWSRHFHGNDPILGPLSGLALHDQDMWRESQIYTVVDCIYWSPCTATGIGSIV